MRMRSWFICVASFLVPVTSSIWAQAKNPDDQFALWMAYDGFLESDSKLGVFKAELEGAKLEIPMLEKIYQKYVELNAEGVGASTVESLKEAQSHWESTKFRVEKLENTVAYYIVDKEINEMIWRWKQGGSIDFILAQDLYWKKWQSRCQSFAYASKEVAAEKTFVDWKYAYSAELAATGIITEEQLLRVAIKQTYLAEREKSYHSLAESCKVGPPFPRLEDFRHLKL